MLHRSLKSAGRLRAHVAAASSFARKRFLSRARYRRPVVRQRASAWQTDLR